MRRKRRYSARCAAFLLAGGLAIQPALAAECLSPSEETAFQSRVIQSDLLVAALTCGARDLYNAFVVKFRPELASRGSIFIDYFKRLHGVKATRQIDSYVTRLANEAALRKLQDKYNYCEMVTGLLQNLMELDTKYYGVFIAEYPQANRHGQMTCATQARLRTQSAPTPADPLPQ